MVGQARADAVAGIGGQDDDAVVLLGEPELALGQHHPVGDLAAELGLLQRSVGPGQHGAGHSHDHGVADREVRGAADDLTQLFTTGIDPAKSQTVGVGMLLEILDTADDEVGVVVALVRSAGTQDALDLEAGGAEAVGQRLGRAGVVDEVAEPGKRKSHTSVCSLSQAGNCARKRTSLS